MVSTYILTIDAGTSNLKISLFREDGTLFTSITKSIPLIHFDRICYEMDMEILWSIVLSTIKEIVASVKVDASSIVGIGITGQGEGCWLIDKNYKPIQNAILWLDKRAADLLSHLSMEDQFRYEAITYSRPFPGSTIALLKWMDTYEKETLRKAKWCLSCKDWIRLKLTGMIATDYSDASTSLLDLQSSYVSDELLELFGISYVKAIFPPVYHSIERGGNITKEIAEQTGLLEGVPVAIGSLDIIANLVGSGAIGEAEMSITVGTTCSNQRSLKTLPQKYEGFGSVLQGALPGQFVKMAGSMAGTPNINWMISTLYGYENSSLQVEDDFFCNLDSEMKEVSIGSEGVMYHPYILMGERAPFYHPHATAQFFGIHKLTTTAHLSRAVYEGVALSIRDCIDNEEGLKRIVLSGGGSKSNILPQIIADCIGVEVLTMDGSEQTSRGAFIIAAIQAGIYDTMEDALRKTKLPTISLKPTLENKSVYDDLFELYKAIRIANMDNWNLRNRFLNKHTNRLEERV